MGRLLEIVTPLHAATKLNYMGWMDDDKVACLLKAPVVQALIDAYGLNAGSSDRDVV